MAGVRTHGTVWRFVRFPGAAYVENAMGHFKNKTAIIGFGLAMAAGAAWAQPAPAPTARDITVGYPEEVALSQEGPKGWVYRRFPGGKRLYVYDLDKNGASVCNADCEGARTPVYARSDAASKGLWTVIARYDGTRQWAYKGQPVYTLFHDDPNAPSGDGEGGVWHIMPFSTVPESAKEILRSP